MNISRLDHLVLTCRDVTATLRFYADVLGMKKVAFGNGRLALCFGNQKINLHEAGKCIEPHAAEPRPGSLDICLIVEGNLDEIEGILSENGIDIELGPVSRVGARGDIESLYVRDPDGNLVELSTYHLTKA